jgi:hypothetical protein
MPGMRVAFSYIATADWMVPTRRANSVWVSPSSVRGGERVGGPLAQDLLGGVPIEARSCLE